MKKIGETVTIKRGKAKGMKGKIVDIEKTFLEVHEDGSFNEEGLLTIESTIPSICLPYSFDGETLKVEHEERVYGDYVQKAYTRVAKFHGYAYTIRPEGISHLVMVTDRELA